MIYSTRFRCARGTAESRAGARDSSPSLHDRSQRGSIMLVTSSRGDVVTSSLPDLKDISLGALREREVSPALIEVVKDFLGQHATVSAFQSYIDKPA
ncbi:hypothetical protein Asp14428_44560 [Actinoplanes sp. NBRC 14428]|nr:hypothetical protein Asp14428_44560 [Actinoplanes sp. NBRC 14428]